MDHIPCACVQSLMVLLQLLEERVTVCDRHGWTQFDPLLDCLEPVNMSADEADVDKNGVKLYPPQYTIIENFWPSEKFTGLMRGFDKHHRADWAAPQRYGKKGKTGGNPPRLRHEGKGKKRKVAPGVAPIGLWRNCYNTAWLDTLDEEDLEKLQIIDEDFDLTLPEEPPEEVDINMDSDASDE